jgi:eukaryotic-like serine/threonine-protein kinase
MESSAKASPTSEQILESLVEDFTAALRSGMHPAISDYQQQHPQLAAEIEEVLSSVALLEQFKAVQLGSDSHLRPLDQLKCLTHIGPYKILHELGRGGMGVVFAAVHESLGRHVAIKVLPSPILNGDTSVERFRHEAQAAARLHHTNIVSVFAAGEGPGYHYYVMDFVDGQSLNCVIEQLRTTALGQSCEAEFGVRFQSQAERFRWSAQLALQMAEALAHAHDSHILHRDIKPSNMILDKAGRIWLTDFGLAKDSSQEVALTKTGDIVGTPQYLPPESLESKYDIRSELYGIGLVLYELVTLRPAYVGSSPAELIRAIASRGPQAVRKLAPTVPADLATIIDKSLEREPSRRYQSAREFARDLSAFLDERPISARRPNALETVWRWARRNRLAASLSATSLLLLMLVAISASVGYVLTTAALQKEALVSHSLREQQTKTESARQQAEQNFQAMKSQFDRAEANMELSIQAFDEIFKHLVARGHKSTVDIEFDGLREISGIETSLTKEDATFLHGMIQFYEQFAVLNAENVLLRSESAKAYRRLGNIYQIVGDLPQAIAAYEAALELLPALTEDSRENLAKETLLTHVRIQNELSMACRQNGYLMRAQEWNSKSIELLERSPYARSDPEVRLEQARTLSALGFDVLRSVNSPTRPLATRPFLAERPVPLDVSKRIWERLNLPLISEAIVILDELLAETPDNDEAIAVRASCYWCLAAAELQRDQSQGIEHRQQALLDLETLVQKHPDRAYYQYLLALACSLTQSQPVPHDVELLERGAALASGLIAQHPTVLDYHHLYAKLKIQLANHNIRQQEPEQALAELKSAKNSLQFLVTRADSDRAFAMTVSALVRELLRLEQIYKEAKNFRATLEITQLLKQIHHARRTNE